MPNIKKGMMGAAGVSAAGYTIFGWGAAYFGAINYRSSPIQIGDASEWLDMSSGGGYVLGIKTGNTLWSWGSAYGGQRGDNLATGTTTSPVQVGSLTDWENVFGGPSCSYATKTDGTLWAWGYGLGGMIGNGGEVSYSSPIQIGSLTDWGSAKIETTLLSVHAIKSDGTLWGWGSGRDGKLGIGTEINTSSPIQVGALTTWTSLGAMATGVAAIRNDGKLFAWGDNGFGFLGFNNTIDYSSPVQIGSLTDWSKVAGHTSGWCAIKADGTMWGVGQNEYYGQVGDSTTISRSSPVQIGALTSWSDIRGTRQNTIALRDDGTLWAWGDNAGRGLNAQGNALNYSSPIQIGSLTNWALIGSSGAASYAAFGIAT